MCQRTACAGVFDAHLWVSLVVRQNCDLCCAGAQSNDGPLIGVPMKTDPGERSDFHGHLFSLLIILPALPV